MNINLDDPFKRTRKIFIDCEVCHYPDAEITSLIFETFNSRDQIKFFMQIDEINDCELQVLKSEKWSKVKDIDASIPAYMYRVVV